MIARPCADCGDIIPTGTYCTDCKPADTRIRRTKGQAAHDPIWRRLSLKVRRLQPWCLDCGAVDDLTADHVLPKADYPELVHAIENLTTRCRGCNSSRTGFTATEAQGVLQRLQSTYSRRPTRKGRERIAAAQRAANQGGHPKPAGQHPGRKAQDALHTQWKM